MRIVSSSAFALLASCVPVTTTPSAEAAVARPNFLVIVIDTLRADALGTYGQRRPTSPNIDALARSAVVFERAWTPYTWTLPSFVSYMTSRWARTHGWDYTMGDFDAYGVLDADAPTLAEVLSGAGYRTIGHYSNEHLRADLGFGRGFDTWMKGADIGVTAAGVREIEGWDRDAAPDFLYLHLMAPHVALMPSKASLDAIGASVAYDPARGIGYDWWSAAPPEEKEARRQEFRAAYFASVRDADASVGKVLDALARSGHEDDTVVVIFSDHGEMLGGHDQIGHGASTWRPLVEVPLIVRIPGMGGSRVSDRVGRLIDVAPTLALMGGARVPPSWQGASLLDATARPAISERDSALAFTLDGRWKILEQRERPDWIAGYDLDRDPGELNPLRVDQGAFSEARGGSARWRDTAPRGRNDGLPPSRTTEERDDALEALRQLGYVE